MTRGRLGIPISAAGRTSTRPGSGRAKRALTLTALAAAFGAALASPAAADDAVPEVPLLPAADASQTVDQAAAVVQAATSAADSVQVVSQDPAAAAAATGAPAPEVAVSVADASSTNTAAVEQTVTQEAAPQVPASDPVPAPATAPEPPAAPAPAPPPAQYQPESSRYHAPEALAGAAQDPNGDSPKEPPAPTKAAPAPTPPSAQSADQDAVVAQNASSAAISQQVLPTNVSVVVRVNSPGDDQVQQENSSSATSSSTNVADVAQTADETESPPAGETAGTPAGETGDPPAGGTGAAPESAPKAPSFGVAPDAEVDMQISPSISQGLPTQVTWNWIWNWTWNAAPDPVSYPLQTGGTAGSVLPIQPAGSSGANPVAIGPTTSIGGVAPQAGYQPVAVASQPWGVSVPGNVRAFAGSFSDIDSFSDIVSRVQGALEGVWVQGPDFVQAWSVQPRAGPAPLLAVTGLPPPEPPRPPPATAPSTDGAAVAVVDGAPPADTKPAPAIVGRAPPVPDVRHARPAHKGPARAKPKKPKKPAPAKADRPVSRVKVDRPVSRATDHREPRVERTFSLAAASPIVAPAAPPQEDGPRTVPSDDRSRSGDAPATATRRHDHRPILQLAHRPAAPAVSPESAGASPSGTGISPLAALIALHLFAAPGFAWLLPAGVTLATGARLADPLERPG
jgi:hypothetical protein